MDPAPSINKVVALIAQEEKQFLHCPQLEVPTQMLQFQKFPLLHKEILTKIANASIVQYALIVQNRAKKEISVLNPHNNLHNPLVFKIHSLIQILSHPTLANITTKASTSSDSTGKNALDTLTQFLLK